MLTRRLAHGPADRILALALAAVAVAGCGAGERGVRAGPSPAAIASVEPSSPASPAPSATAPIRSARSPAATASDWRLPTEEASLEGLRARLACDRPAQPSMPDATGSAPYRNVAEPTIDAAFGRFLAQNGDMVGFVPLAGWSELDGGTTWATFAHVVGGRPKALATFSATPEGSDTRWSWTVAACDPSEFAPGVPISDHVVVWTDEDGNRVPLERVRERGLCGAEPATVAVDGRLFAHGDLYRERMLGTFATGVALPADAAATPYRDGTRRIWLAADRLAAYVGTIGHLERWPRLRDDDDSVTDCN